MQFNTILEGFKGYHVFNSIGTYFTAISRTLLWLRGIIYVLIFVKMDSLEKPQIICHAEKSLTYSVNDVKWIPSSAKFVAMGGNPNGSGIVEIYRLNTGGFEKVGEFGKKEHFKCGTFDASSLNKRHLATGDYTGRMQVW